MIGITIHEYSILQAIQNHGTKAPKAMQNPWWHLNRRPSGVSILPPWSVNTVGKIWTFSKV